MEPNTFTQVAQQKRWVQSRGGTLGSLSGGLLKHLLGPPVDSNYEFAHLGAVWNANLLLHYGYQKCAVKEGGGTFGFLL